MTTPNINLKKDVFESSCGLSFEDMNDGGELHKDKKVDRATLARGKAALKLFSLGGILA